MSAPQAVGLAATALAGAIAWFAVTAAAAFEGGMVLGVFWPLAAMAFVACLQRGMNRVIDGAR